MCATLIRPLYTFCDFMNRSFTVLRFYGPRFYVIGLLSSRKMIFHTNTALNLFSSQLS